MPTCDKSWKILTLIGGSSWVERERNSKYTHTHTRMKYVYNLAFYGMILNCELLTYILKCLYLRPTHNVNHRVVCTYYGKTIPWTLWCRYFEQVPIAWTVMLEIHRITWRCVYTAVLYSFGFGEGGESI